MSEDDYREPFHCFVEGTPRSMPRPRVFGKRAVSLPEGVNKQWRDIVRRTVRDECLKDKLPPFTGPVRVELVFNIPIKTKKLWGLPHDKRPDIDNLAKLVLDAMQPAKGDSLWKGVYSDDNVVAELMLRKKYSDNPGVWITVTDL